MKKYRGFDLDVESHQNIIELPIEIEQGILTIKRETFNGWTVHENLGLVKPLALEPVKPLIPKFTHCCHCYKSFKMNDPNFLIEDRNYCPDCMEQGKYFRD